MSEEIAEAAVEGAHGEEWLNQYHSLMEIFEELTFREKVHKLFHGLKQPVDSGEYKWAKLQLLRLSAPISAVVVPILVLVILTTLAVVRPPSRIVEVQIIEPDTLEDLEEIEDIIEEPLEPPEVEMEIPDEAVMTDFENPNPTPSQDFSPVPADFDSVAIVKSPVILKGILGSRSPGMRGSLLGQHGGSGATELCVMRALRWLKKNQNPDGSWPTVKPASTALALLTFLAHGETPASDEFGYTVESAIRWLVDNQEASGHFKGRDGHDYSHPIAAYALCEAFALTKIPMVKEAAEKAIQLVIDGQHASGGWDYNLKDSQRDDTSYMGWCAQALKAAYLSGVDANGLDAAMKKSIAGFRKNCKMGDYATFGYTSPGNTGLTGVGVLCMQLLGAAKSREVTGGLAALEKTTFNWDGTGTYNKNYYWYYITQAKFHEGGDTWKNWNKMFSPVLIKNQIIEKNAIMGPNGKMVDIGHWAPDKELSGHTDPEGRVMNTCLCALQLQVYYRYLPTFKTPKEIEEEVVLEDENEDIEIEIL